ncbi:cytochrome C oxidase subunit IV family protein [Rhodococcus gannanensis]|uniref:Cytochrome C oxidase subunit IV family protein n=1 Tax=Rhodococcus gannanensis TaxID=1960308 RepID=A0ABW4NXY0_9NOCA
MTTANKTLRAASARTVTVAWLVLVALTLGAWWLAPAHVAGDVQASTPITVMVLALAFVKSRMIIRYFMEVRTAPGWLRVATDVWLVVLVVVVLTIYLW